jgi:hypothetical protein
LFLDLQLQFSQIHLEDRLEIGKMKEVFSSKLDTDMVSNQLKTWMEL